MQCKERIGRYLQTRLQQDSDQAQKNRRWNNRLPFFFGCVLKRVFCFWPSPTFHHIIIEPYKSITKGHNKILHIGEWHLQQTSKIFCLSCFVYITNGTQNNTGMYTKESSQPTFKIYHTTIGTRFDHLFSQGKTSLWFSHLFNVLGLWILNWVNAMSVTLMVFF